MKYLLIICAGLVLLGAGCAKQPIPEPTIKIPVKGGWNTEYEGEMESDAKWNKELPLSEALQLLINAEGWKYQEKVDLYALCQKTRISKDTKCDDVYIPSKLTK